MTRRIVQLILSNPVFANILLVFIMVSGFLAAGSMIREIFPRFSMDRIQVSVSYPGADPEETEEGICLKLEDALEGIEDVKRVNTTAKDGVGSAIVECSESADISEVKDEVANRVESIVSFPEDAEKPTVRELKFKGDVLSLAVWGEVPEHQLKETGRRIRDDLMGFDNISQVTLAGTREYEVSIEVSEEQLRRFGLSFEEISERIAANTLNLHGGTIRTENEEIKIRSIGRRYLASEYENIPLLTRDDGTVVTVGQIGKARDSFDQDQVTYSLFNGKPSVSVNVYKTEEEDSLEISDTVKEYLEGALKELPPQINITLWKDNSRLVMDRLDMLVDNGLIGLLLVFLSLWIFLELRLSFWVTMGIPISIAGGLAVMGILGQSLNMLSLFGLIMVLGLIVDDAIVVGEAIYLHRKKQDSFSAALTGTTEVAWPVIAAVLTTLVAFTPLFFVKGIMGKFIGHIPVPVIAALSISLIEALFILPVHLRHLPPPGSSKDFTGAAGRFFSRQRKRFSAWLERVVEKKYSPAVIAVLRWRYTAVAASIGIFIITLGLISSGFIEFVLFPESDDDFIRARVELLPGTSAEKSKEVSREISAAWRRVEEKMKDEHSHLKGKNLSVAVSSLIGASLRDEWDLAGSNSNLIEVAVELLPSEQRHIHYRELVQEWKDEAGRISGAILTDFGSFQHGPGGNPVEIMFLGSDLDELVSAGEALMEELRGLNGVYDIQMDYKPGRREYRVTLKPEAYSLGLSVEKIARHINRGYFGGEPLRVQRGQDDVRVKVRYPEKEGRDSVSAFENMKIKTASGSMVPLSSVANIELGEAQTAIRRQNKKRVITVSADVNRKTANSEQIMHEVVNNFLPGLLAEYNDLSFSTEGQSRETRDSLETLKVGFLLAMLGIYLVIATIFRSYIQPLVIMLTIPFGMIGAVFGHAFRGIVMLEGPMPVTMMSAFGMVALAGMVVNDAIVLIEAVNERLAEGMSISEAIVEGGKRRFRAIFLTTLTTFSGLTPIMLERSLQAQFVIPMAISIAFGVLFASVLTLFLIPCFFMIVNDLRRNIYYLWNGEWLKREELEPRAKTHSTEPISKLSVTARSFETGSTNKNLEGEYGEKQT